MLNFGLWEVFSCFSIAAAVVDAVGTVQCSNTVVFATCMYVVLRLITITPEVDTTAVDVTDVTHVDTLICCYLPIVVRPVVAIFQN